VNARTRSDIVAADHGMTASRAAEEMLRKATYGDQRDEARRVLRDALEVAIRGARYESGDSGSDAR